MMTAGMDTPGATPQSTESQRFPRDAFRYCPRCGHDNLETANDRAIKCRVCGFQFFFNAATASGAFIFYGESLILCVRARDPEKGKLDVPGGFMDYDESIEQGLQREIREELNIQAENYTYLTSAPNDYLYAGVLYKVTDVFFTCTASHIDTIAPADDVADYRLVKPEEVDPAQFAFSSTRNAFMQLLAKYSLRESSGLK